MTPLSIIIPHKDSSKLLERLLRSIPSSIGAQIMVIDDHSSPEEYQALDALSKVYSFELYRNSNNRFGAGVARNIGLEYSTGEWIIFADVGDLFLDSLVEKFKQYKDCDYDIVFFDISSCYSDTSRLTHKYKNTKSAIKKYLSTKNDGHLRYNYSSSCGKFIKQSLLAENYIDFEKIISGSEVVFSVKSGLAAKVICYDPDPIYTLTTSAENATSPLARERFNSKFKATLRANKLLRDNNKGEFQISMLYFLAKAPKFGFRYFISVVYSCLKSR
ncbi:MAG: glycosyltransferase family A protein [Rikenellaceae bacterium]